MRFALKLPDSPVFWVLFFVQKYRNVWSTKFLFSRALAYFPKFEIVIQTRCQTSESANFSHMTCTYFEIISCAGISGQAIFSQNRRRILQKCELSTMQSRCHRPQIHPWCCQKLFNFCSRCISGKYEFDKKSQKSK